MLALRPNEASSNGKFPRFDGNNVRTAEALEQKAGQAEEQRDVFVPNDACRERKLQQQGLSRSNEMGSSYSVKGKRQRSAATAATPSNSASRQVPELADTPGTPPHCSGTPSAFVPTLGR
jgi:hypothetical protein